MERQRRRDGENVKDKVPGAGQSAKWGSLPIYRCSPRPRTVPTPHVPLSYIDTVERDNPGSDCNVVGQHEASVRTWSLL